MPLHALFDTTALISAFLRPQGVAGLLFNAAKQLLEGPHGHPSQLPRLAKGELALLKQQDGEFPLHFFWGHTGGMQDFLGNFDRYC